MEHDVIPAGERHAPHNWEVADESARLALSTSTGDVGKTAWQKSDNTIWICTAAGSWAQMVASGLPIQIAYGNTIPLDGVKVMPRTQIASAITLVIGAKVPGGQCRVPFISDGANFPSITGASEWASSFGFYSGAGLVNVLDVWTDDGVNVAFAWSQPANQSPADVLGPTISSVTVNGATMVVTYNEPLAATPAAAAYTVRNAGGAATQVPSAVSRSGSVVTLTLATPAVNGNTVTLDVTAGAVSDVIGNPSLAVSGRAVTNNTAPADTTGPSISSASINGPTATVVWSEVVAGTPSASAFTFVGAGGITQAASGVSQSGATTTLTLATPAVSGNVVTLNVTAGAVVDGIGNPSLAITARAVTNNTAGIAVPANFSTLQNLADEGGGTYASTSAGGPNDSIGVVAGVLAGDGYIEAQKLNTTDCSFYLRFDIVSGFITVTDADCAFGVSTAGLLAHGENANPTVSATNIGGNASTWLRLERAGSVITGKYSTDNKVSWTTFRTFTLSTTGTLYVSVSVPYSGGPRRIYNPRTLAVA